MPNPTILLADDDTVYLETATEFLSAHDYDVVWTTDPVEAKQWLQDRPFALAFLDIRFDPTDDRDESGLKIVLDTMDVSSVPKVMLTQFDETQYAVKSLKPRADGKTPAVDFVSKKDGLDRLLEVTRRHLSRARIFLSYVHEDHSAVNAIYEALSCAGFIPWIYQKNLAGGVKWKRAISREIKNSDLFVVCLSKKSYARNGHFHKEINEAFDVLEEMRPGSIYIVPVRLEECVITDDRIKELHWVDLFNYPDSPESKEGFNQLVGSIKLAMTQRVNGEFKY